MPRKELRRECLIFPRLQQIDVKKLFSKPEFVQAYKNLVRIPSSIKKQLPIRNVSLIIIA